MTRASAVAAAVPLALGAAACFGLQAVVVRAGMRRASSFAAAFVSVVVSAGLFWLLAAVRGIPPAVTTLESVLPFVVAGLAYPAAFRLLYFEGIDRVGPSVAAAIIAANPLVAAGLAIAVLGEAMTPLVVGGVALIIVGGVALQLAGAGDEDDDAADVLVRTLRAADSRDLLYPVAAMVLYGGASVLIKFGLDGFGHPATATALTQTSALVAFLAVMAVSGSARRNVRVRDRVALGLFVVAGVFVALAWLGQFFALQLGTVVTVIPLVNTYPLVVVALTYLLARELPRSPRVLAGVVAIVAGATLLSV